MYISANPAYEVVARECNSPIDLDLVKKHLEKDYSDTTDDFYIQQIIKSVVQYFESRTNTILLTTTFRLYIDCFLPIIEIRRKPNVVVTTVDYYLDGVLTTVDPLIYYQLFSARYASILPVTGESWPSDGDSRLQAVQVNFTAGYGPTFDSVPADLVMALLQHIASIYENRGDCSDCSTGLPESSSAVYKIYTVYNISMGC